MNDPSQSGPTFPLIAGVMNYLGGVSAGRELLLHAEVQRPDHPPDQRPDAAGADQRPDQPGAGAVARPAIGATFTDKNIGISTSSPATLLPCAIGIDAKASPQVQAEAEKFIEYVLSPAGQKVMQTGDPTGDSLYYPVVNGVSPLSAAARRCASRSRPRDRPLHLGPAGGDQSTPGSTPTSSVDHRHSRGDDPPGAPRARGGYPPPVSPGPARSFALLAGWRRLYPGLAAPGAARHAAVLADPVRLHPAARAPASCCSRSRRGCSTRERSGSR